MSKKARGSTWQDREMALVAEWVEANYPDAEKHYRMRLGTLPALPGAGPYADAERNATNPWRRWADCVIITDAELIVVEGKIRPDVGVVSQIEMYLDLIPVTPELVDKLTRTLTGLLLVAVDDPSLRVLAGRRNFRYVVYRPAWVDDYLRELYPRQSRPRTGYTP